jgi:hypothetical protein
VADTTPSARVGEPEVLVYSSFFALLSLRTGGVLSAAWSSRLCECCCTDYADCHYQRQCKDSCADHSMPPGNLFHAVAFEQSPPFFVSLAPGLAFDLNPTALLARPVRCIAALRDYALEVHTIGGGKQLEAIIETFRVAQPVGACGQD